MKEKLSINKILLNLQNDGIPDRFVVAGANYKIIREVITRVILGEESQHIDRVLQVGSWWPGAPSYGLSLLRVESVGIVMSVFVRHM